VWAGSRRGLCLGRSRGRSRQTNGGTNRCRANLGRRAGFIRDRWPAEPTEVARTLEILGQAREETLALIASASHANSIGTTPNGCCLHGPHGARSDRWGGTSLTPRAVTISRHWEYHRFHAPLISLRNCAAHIITCDRH
jgi:hypothetical protein